MTLVEGIFTFYLFLVFLLPQPCFPRAQLSDRNFLPHAKILCGILKSKLCCKITHCFKLLLAWVCEWLIHLEGFALTQGLLLWWVHSTDSRQRSGWGRRVLGWLLMSHIAPWRHQHAFEAVCLVVLLNYFLGMFKSAHSVLCKWLENRDRSLGRACRVWLLLYAQSKFINSSAEEAL